MGVNSEDAITVEYKGDHQFEILVKPDEAFAYRRGELDDFTRVLFVQEIFTDAAAAERAGMEEIEDEFGTRNVVEAAQQLFDNGRMELTTDQKNRLREEKRRQVINRIATRAMNPQTNTPHPPQRIENALDETGIDIDPLESVEDQIPGVIDAIKPKIPITLEEKEIVVKIPNKYAGECYGDVRKFSSEVLEEQWENDAFYARVRLPAGMQTKLAEKLESKTHGAVEIKDA